MTNLIDLSPGIQQQVDKALSLVGKKFKDLDLTNVYAAAPPPLTLPSLPMTSWVRMHILAALYTVLNRFSRCKRVAHVSRFKFIDDGYIFASCLCFYSLVLDPPFIVNHHILHTVLHPLFICKLCLMIPYIFRQSFSEFVLQPLLSVFVCL